MDSDDIGPAPFQPGDRVYVKPYKREATVVRQIKSYDGPETFWGNVILLYDDGLQGTSNSWQCEHVSH